MRPLCAIHSLHHLLHTNFSPNHKNTHTQAENETSHKAQRHALNSLTHSLTHSQAVFLPQVKLLTPHLQLNTSSSQRISTSNNPSMTRRSKPHKLKSRSRALALSQIARLRLQSSVVFVPSSSLISMHSARVSSSLLSPTHFQCVQWLLGFKARGCKFALLSDVQTRKS